MRRLSALTPFFQETDTNDHIFLQRVARQQAAELYKELKDKGLSESLSLLKERLPPVNLDVYKDSLAWILWESNQPGCPVRPQPQVDPSTIQGNILTSYRDMSHGVIVLASITDPTKAAKALRWAADAVQTEGAFPGAPVMNLSLTCAGLARLGLDDELPGNFSSAF